MDLKSAISGKKRNDVTSSRRIPHRVSKMQLVPLEMEPIRLQNRGYKMKVCNRNPKVSPWISAADSTMDLSHSNGGRIEERCILGCSLDVPNGGSHRVVGWSPILSPPTMWCKCRERTISIDLIRLHPALIYISGYLGPMMGIQKIPSLC